MGDAVGNAEFVPFQINYIPVDEDETGFLNATAISCDKSYDVSF